MMQMSSRSHPKIDYYSKPEKIFRGILEELGLKKGVDWEHNVQIPNCEATANFLVYSIIDFEIGGAPWHGERWYERAREKDRKRDKKLKEAGVKVHRISARSLHRRTQIKLRVKKIIRSYFPDRI